MTRPMRVNQYGPGWPKSDVFLNIAAIRQELDGHARCMRIAICNDRGETAEIFEHGQVIHFFHEWLIEKELAVPSGGVEFHLAEGLVIHGKNSFQYLESLPKKVESGKKIRFHQQIKLDVAPGRYWFSLGFASIPLEEYEKYSQKMIGHDLFQPTTHGRVVDVSSFEVSHQASGQLAHHGICNLQGDGTLEIIDDDFTQDLTLLPSTLKKETLPDLPTILHITHWKAGSQWINKLLNEISGERIVKPVLNQSQFLSTPIKPGAIYPSLYVTKNQMDRISLPANTKKFIIFRDLRDVLVSAFFSMKFSHPELGNELSGLRTRLAPLNMEEGLLYMLKEWLPACANIQISWINAGESFIRYEDLLTGDLDLLKKALIDECAIGISEEKLSSAVINNRFKILLEAVVEA